MMNLKAFEKAEIIRSLAWQVIAFAAMADASFPCRMHPPSIIIISEHIVHGYRYRNYSQVRLVIQLKTMTVGTKQILRNVLGGRNKAREAKTVVSNGGTHTQRRLHQMMLEDRDFERNGCSVGDPVKDHDCWHQAETVDSNGPEAYQEYCIRHVDDSHVISEPERQTMVQCIEAAIERRVFEVDCFVSAAPKMIDAFICFPSAISLPLSLCVCKGLKKIFACCFCRMVRGLMLDMYDFENDIWLCQLLSWKMLQLHSICCPAIAACSLPLPNRNMPKKEKAQVLNLHVIIASKRLFVGFYIGF
ncbi:ACT domain-containing protein [Tanacetum coccineum]